MAKAPTQQTGKFEFRVGGGDPTFAYKGMMQDPDPGAIPPDRLRYVRNGRYQGGAVISRPPYEPVIAVEKFNRETIINSVRWSNDWHWDLHYFTEHHPAFPVRVWYAGQGTDYAGQAAGEVGFIDLEADPMVQSVALYPQASGRTPSIAKFDGEIYVGEYGFLRKIYQIKTPAGIIPADYGSLPADDIIWNFGAAFVSVLHAHLGKLYMLITDLGDPPGDAAIYSYDGLTIALEYTLTGIAGATGAGAVTWQDKLVFAVNGSEYIYIKAADGTWSTATCPNFLVSSSKNCMTANSQGVWIASGTTYLYKFDGTTLAVAMEAPWPHERLKACTTLGDDLFYGTSIQYSGNWYRHYLNLNLLYFFEYSEGAIEGMCAHGGRLFVAYGGAVWTHPTPYVICDGPGGLTEEEYGWFTPVGKASVNSQYRFAPAFLMST